MNQLNRILSRLLPAMGAAALLVAAGCGTADTPATDNGGDSALAVATRNPDVARAVQTSRDHLMTARAKLGMDANNDFRARTASTDELGQIHVRYDQMYRGVRVWEGDGIVHVTKRGTNVTSDFKGGINLRTTPALAAADVLNIAHRDLRPRGSYAVNPTAELIVYPHTREQVRADARKGGELNAMDMERVIAGYSLAYHVHTELENGTTETRHTDYIIDAQSGSILKKWDTLHTAAATGTGNSQYSGVKTINVDSVTGGWNMSTGAGSTTRMAYITYNLNHATSGTGTIYNDTDNTWGDGANYVEGSSTTAANGQTAAVDAHYGVGATSDYYFNVLGRNGINGAGRATYSRVHYSNSYDNAFWSDTCFCMTYGDGSSFTTLTSIDVAGHEMAHGVTANTANLTYSGESGGLNESMSDINGTMVEFYSRGGSGSTIGNTGGNWLIGEQLNATPLRYMYRPSRDGSSPDAWSSTVGNLDVHYSSGPQNRMFYFLSQGALATGATSGTCASTTLSDCTSTYRTCGMTGIGNDAAARIAYRALANYMTASTNYAAARTAYLSAASDLYGTASAEYAAVQNAFSAINVGAGATTCGATSPTISTSPTSMTFSGTAGGANPASQTLSISNSGGGTLTWTGSDNAAWLTLSATSGTAPSSVTVSVSTSGLAAGTYSGTITITATGASNSPYSVPVTLNVTTSGGGGGNVLANPGFESGAVSWTQTTGVIDSTAGVARTGTWAAWLNGYGTTHTDSIYQQIVVPSSTAQFCFYLRVTSAETTTTTQYDRLQVQLRNSAGSVLTTLATFSNLNRTNHASYTQHCYSVGSYNGQTIRPYFLGTEDASLQTSFFIDDTSLQ